MILACVGILEDHLKGAAVFSGCPNGMLDVLADGPGIELAAEVSGMRLP